MKKQPNILWPYMTNSIKRTRHACGLEQKRQQPNKERNRPRAVSSRGSTADSDMLGRSRGAEELEKNDCQVK